MAKDPIDAVNIFRRNMDILIGRYHQMVADGLLSIDDAVTLTLAACNDIGALLGAIGNPFLDKEQIIMDYFGVFYDKVIGPAISEKIPLLGSTVGKMLKSTLTLLVRSQINMALEYLRTHGLPISRQELVQLRMPGDTTNEYACAFGSTVPLALRERLADPVAKKQPVIEGESK